MSTVALWIHQLLNGNMAGYIEKIDAFDRSVEDWPTCIERLQQFLKVNVIDETKQVSALLSVVGGKATSWVQANHVTLLLHS